MYKIIIQKKTMMTQHLLFIIIYKLLIMIGDELIDYYNKIYMKRLD